MKLELEGKKGPDRDKNGKLVVPSTTSPSQHLFFRWDEPGLVSDWNAYFTFAQGVWQMLSPNDDIKMI